MKIALTQMNIIWEDKSANKCICEGLIKKASENNADIIIFPEMTLTGFTMNTEYAGEEKIKGGDTLTFFAELSKRYNMPVVFGMVHKENETSYNKAIMTDGNNILLNYSKLHPFSYGGEASVYGKGENIVSTEYRGASIGCFVCYDLRFPEIFQISSKRNDIIIVIANWPETRVEHWYTLLKARAIENQAFIIGVNRTGMGGGLSYVPSSVAFSPYGEKITADSDDEIIYADIDILEAWQCRKAFPVKEDRREELYGRFWNKV